MWLQIIGTPWLCGAHGERFLLPPRRALYNLIPAYYMPFW